MQRSRAALEIGRDVARQRAEFRNAITGWSDDDLIRAALNYVHERETHPRGWRFYTVRLRAIQNEMKIRWSN